MLICKKDNKSGVEQPQKFRGKYRIESTRLQTWDYSNDGAYFVTICTKNREHYFGEIKNEKLTATESAKICLQFWQDLPNHYQNCFLDEFVIMPNHVHGIIMIDNDAYTPPVETIPVKTIHELSLRGRGQKQKNMDEYRKFRRQMTLSKIIGRFKMQTAKKINEYQNTQGQTFWQSRFYDRIVRDSDELNRIREYIINNPLQWEMDKNNPENLYI